MGGLFAGLAPEVVEEAAFLVLVDGLAVEVFAVFVVLALAVVGGMTYGLASKGWWITFVAPGVGSVVQYHLPSASAQAWPLSAAP